MPKRKQKKKRVNIKPDLQQNRNRKQMQRDVKDRLFRYLFEKDSEALLDLYNALNGTAYRDSSQLEIMTIESAVYVVMKNDLYSAFVAVTRECMSEEKDIQNALNRAVDACIEKGILKEFLLKNRAEVLGMLLEEFDAEKYERTIRGEGREEGLKIGIRYSIEILQEVNQSRGETKKKLMEKYAMSETEVERELQLYLEVENISKLSFRAGTSEEIICGVRAGGRKTERRIRIEYSYE